MLTLLAALFQAAISVLMPLPAAPVSPVTTDEAHARLLTAHGTEPLCMEAEEHGTRAPPGGHPVPGGMHDCPLCPICSTLRHIATFTGPPPSVLAGIHPPFLATAARIPIVPDVFPAPRLSLSPANPRAPPALT